MKRKGIIFYYIVAIVIPCFLLGILAFRGIKNDQALVEREQHRVLQETTQQIFQDLNKYLLKTENSFKELTLPDTFPSQLIFNDSNLSLFCSKNDILEGIVYLKNKTEFYLYNNELIYLPDGSLTGSEDLLSFETLKDGWQYEFNTKEYNKALGFYSSLYQNRKQKQARGVLLNAMARIHKKQGNFDSALEIYDSLQNNYSRVLLQKNIPLGIVAYLEKNNCYLRLNDTLSSLENSVELINKLAIKNWQIEKAYYYDYLEKAENLILKYQDAENKSIRKLVEKAGRIKDSLHIHQQKTEHLLTFFDKLETISANSIQKNITGNSIRRYRINGDEYLYSVLSMGNNIETILLFDAATLLQNVLIPMLREHSSSLNFYWEIANEHGRLAGSENIPDDIFPVVSVFPGGLPSWSLAFYPLNRGLLTTFFQSGGGLFFFIFIVVLLVLVFGLFFTLQTVNHNIQLSKMKSTFVSTVSHELRSPLTSIRQIAEILVNKRMPTEERKEKYFSMILQQSEKLSHLIENILDFSKIEAGQKKFRFEKVDLANITEKVIRSFQDQITIPDFEINLIISDKIININGDCEALEQVIHNLVDNAIKYSGNSKKIDVKIELFEEKAVFSVTDFGVGIPKEEQEKIFNQFYRAGDELTQTVKGTGIGLTIVKQIVNAHKGEITVESGSGEGSAFILKFPV